MILKYINKKAIGVILIAVFSVLPFASQGKCEKKFEYIKKDKVEEQKKFVVKLKDDKRKTQMAIISTKALIDKSRNKPYLPELYLRLAELYIEKSRIVYFIQRNQPAASTKSLNKLEVNSLKNQAIEIYQRILGNYPKYKDRDKVHFFMAHEYRELGQTGLMIKQYRTIISKYKKSGYVPEVHLLLGDHFFNVKQDLELAERHYKSVLRYPKSAAVAVARYKLAWCHINKTRYKEAIKLLEQSVIANATDSTDIDTYKKVDIRLESLIDMAFCYTEAYKKKKPMEAIAYFEKYAWSRPAFSLVLEKLGYRYFIKKKWAHSVEIYRQLSVLNHDASRLLEYAGYIFECVKEMGKFEDADKDMAYIIKALKRQKYSIHFTDEEKKKSMTDFELYARDIVTHLHQKARKRKSVKDFMHAADSYKLYVEFFKDSPVRKEMAYNYAETLFSAQQYLEAGKQYEKIALTMQKQDKKRREKLYSAVLSYYNALKKKDSMDYYKTAFARSGLKTSGRSFVNDFPSSSKVPEILFNVAWISYDEGKYNEAISEFSRFVEHYPTGKEAKVAIHLILDSFNLKEDFEGLIKYGKRIVDNKKVDYKLRKEVAQIVQTSESKVISSMTVVALNDWEKGRSDLMEFVEDNKSTGLGEQALSALIVSSRENGDLVSLYSAGSQFINRYPSSPKLEGIMGDMIDASLKTSQFRLTAKYLETFANKFPGHKNAGEFLYEAAHIRENLGQNQLAIKDYQKYLSRSTKKSSLSREVVFSIANNAEDMGKSDLAIKVLGENRKYLSQVEKIKADARVADYYLKKRNSKKAAIYRKRAYNAYKPHFGKKDGDINAVMAKMVYNAVQVKYGRYMAVKLKNKIDNKIVANKAKLLESLEKSYHSIIKYQSPEWALKACFRSYEINKEFARFLKSSPLPQLTAEQKQQYIQIIDQKAQAYTAKAHQYLDTCSQQARKWEICDPKLTRFYLNIADANTPEKEAGRSKGKNSFEIAEKSMSDQTLKRLHYRLVQNPKDMETMIALSRLYFEKGDFRHAILTSQKAIEGLKKGRSQMKATAYNIYGLSQLYAGNDQTAKDAFKDALSADSKNIGARINLAGLFQHYGHPGKAEKIYRSISNMKIVEKAQDLIHPHAKELYYDRFRKAKK